MSGDAFLVIRSLYPAQVDIGGNSKARLFIDFRFDSVMGLK